MSEIKAHTRSPSAPDGHINIGTPVIARRGPGEPEFHARVVWRAIGVSLFDVETADGEVIRGMTRVRLDENALAIRRAIYALDCDQLPGFARNGGTSRKQTENAPHAWPVICKTQ